jgi:hypothetical protein
MNYCLETQFNRIMKRYKSSQFENSLAKNIPIRRLPLFKMLYPGKFRYRYRGASINNFYKRPQSYCHRLYAQRFAVYER